jgi:predicted ferric reductase
MKVNLSARFILVGSVLLITTLLWGFAHKSNLYNVDFLFWRAFAQILMLWSATLAILSILSVVKAKSLEFLFEGLDQAIILHRKLGLASLITLVVHVIFLCIDAFTHDRSVLNLLIPTWSNENRSLDIIVFYLLFGLGILAYSKSLRYEPWLRFHRFIGLLFILGTLHAAIEPGTVAEYEPLRFWIILLLIIGILTWAYRIYFFQKFGPQYRYKVISVNSKVNSRIIDLLLEPITKRMMFVPGNFVYISVPSFKGMERESHPFSISSCPTERNLRLSINQVGDFTQRLSSLKGKEYVDIFGPFGNFTIHHFAHYRRLVWIGSGIGITPFLSMLNFEKANKDFRRIWLYYIVRNASDATYDREIKSTFMGVDSFIDYNLWETSSQGRITAEKIVDQILVDDYAVMICGNKNFTEDIKKQFLSLGLPSERIITEELQFL